MIYDGDTENTSMNVKSSCTLMYSPQTTAAGWKFESQNVKFRPVENPRADILRE